MKKLVYLSLIITSVAFFMACDKNEVEYPSKKDVSSKIKESNQIIESFAKSLAVVLQDNEKCRELIKSEAARKINFDYDVLYMLVKDKDLGNGATLESLMLNYMDAKDLKFISNSFPTLTIFVPTLPENSFSCELWDTKTEIPDVAIRSNNNLQTYCFDAKGNEYVLDSDEIPGFPIVVLKINERIAVKKNTGGNSPVLRSMGNLEFEFTDPIFNNISLKSETRVQNPNDIKLKKVIDAYSIFPNNLTGWQRDYVYYDLKNNDDKGRFDLRYKECLVGIEFLGNPDGLLNKIKDQAGDPELIDRNGWFEPLREKKIQGKTVLTPWTDGEFEFEVLCQIVNKTLDGNSFKTRIRCAPERLFEVTLIQKTKGILFWKKTIYKVTDIKFLYLSLDIPLFEWDIEKYGVSCKISISEFDLSTTVTETNENTSEFATNFSFEANWGEKVKKGLKFGASEKETHKSSTTITRSLNSDELGTFIINFGDEVILSDQTRQVEVGSETGSIFRKTILDYNGKYKNDYCRIHIAPLYLGK